VGAITRLERNPPQLALLARQLLAREGPAPLRVAVHGVADGSEAVSLLVALAPRPDDGLLIHGFDFNATWLDLAGRFSYPRQPLRSEARRFLRRTVTGRWRLRRPWRRFLRFAPRDVTEPGDGTTYDLVLCQNVLIGLDVDLLPGAVANLVNEVAPGGLLAIGGGPLDRVPGLVREHGLEPVLDHVEIIHESWKVQRRFYDHAKRPRWSLEPFDKSHPDGTVRYCTLFRRRVD
jgi:chemotaxis methyl-accepting protein methylase